MGLAQGWLALVMAGITAAPVAKTQGPEITYTFSVAEARGLAWREAAAGKLKPVAHRDGVTIWTAPRSLFDGKHLPEGAVTSWTICPKVSSYSRATAHVTNRANRAYVAQAAWSGDESAPRSTADSVREGFAATVSGRLLDQGVLVDLVVDDTDVRAVHTVNLGCTTEAARAKADCGAGEKTLCVQNSEGCETVCPVAGPAKQTATGECGETSCPASGHSKSIDTATKKAGWEPVGGAVCCDAAGAKAASCPAEKTAEKVTNGEKGRWIATAPAPSQIQIPEVSHAEVAGEWLVPNGEVLVIGFGPHTMADADGKAVVRERLAVLHAEEVPSGAHHTATSARLVQPMAPRAAVAASLPMPSLPSRSIPQGVHADGSPAALPPLPEDEKPDASASISSDPLPSPQAKRPKAEPAPTTPSPAPASAPAPAGDAKARKVSFLPDLLRPRQAGLFPLPLPGLQFQVPLKPLSLKLPFNQMLELELFGRVVPDPEAGLTQE